MAQEALPVTEVAPGVYVAAGVHEEASADNLGAIGNVGFIVGGEAVAVIDTGGSARAGQQLRQAVRAVTRLPIRFVVNTHVHPDHIMGNSAFVGDAPQFIGHRNLTRAIAARGEHYLRRLRDELGPAAEGTRLIPPTRTVDGMAEIDLGGRVLRLTAYPAAHTDTDLSVLDVATSVLWTGDLLFIERIPVVDGSLRGWLAVSGDLRGTEAVLLVPGHGPPTAEGDAAFDAQERYLRRLLTEIRALIAQGGSMEQAVETVGVSERNRWVLFDAYHARNVVTAYVEIEWE
ncbi:MAG: quinoprotein relay system zinc metallohydrolase 2 [Alphaproteobacteria bacterium]|nr:quinoprotein relay system zinc metallohydrolase 2 [Alphaproteobacteria bacterium]